MFKIKFHTSGLSHKDLIKRAYRRFFVSLFFVILVFGLAGFATGKLGWFQKQMATNPSVGSTTVPPSDKSEPVVVPTVAPSKEVKKEISKNPPKTSSAVKSSETTNADGSKTGTVAEGGAVASALSGAANNTGSSSPFGVPFSDETGSNATLEPILKNYLNSLRWKGEMSALKEIVIQDAGNTGWAGQWGGTYYMNSSGDITSAYGVIILNVYYYKSSPYFNDYMKLVLSHEYGHHYTQYHKWVDGDLPINVRMPDSYYSVRPLSKSATTLDCSASWSTCEPEIIAEDYSYLYSGYGYDAMAAQFGYPSDPGTRNWLDNIETSVKSSAPAANQVPTVTLTAPTNGATISGTVALTATASDDSGVSKVRFMIDSITLVDDTSVPYSFDLNTETISNENHTIKAIVYDSAGLTGESSVTVTVDNSVAPPPSEPDMEVPTVSFTKPTPDPYSWENGNLIISVDSNDNIEVVKIELYINDQLALTVNNSKFSARWDYDSAGPGDYTLTVKAYDAAGNIGTASLLVNKE